MAAFILLLSLLFVAASGESPIVNDDDCVEPTSPCPKNEERRCRQPCPPETCITLYAAFRCIANQTCVEGCYCKQGFLRSGVGGTCVLPDQCLPLECVNDPNAIRGCGNRCRKTCADYNDKRKICAKGPCKKNGCDCKDEYIYDDNVGKCVKPKECTKQCTKPNERYSNCLLGECVPKKCEDLGKPLPCPGVGGPCAGGCICKEGYVRNTNGDCIETKKCPSCGGDPNAVSGCGNPCGKTCDSYNKTDLGCAQYCKVNGCDCKDGFVLNQDTKKCVLIKDCHKSTQCTKPHERYSKCPLGECVAKTCDDLGKPIACPSIADPCPGGCICEEGYVRNKQGECIEKNNCPSCGGDPNAVSGCGNPCGKTCDSYNKTDIVCLQYCEVNGCDCRDGFVLNEDIKKCVLKKDCPKPKQCTKTHEKYSKCPLGECVAKTCDDLGKPIACPAIAGPCLGGCVCEEGFVRNKQGECIEKNNCPSCGGDPNALSGCGNPCGQTCDSYNKTDVVCPQYCEVNGCDCRDGFVLNEDLKKCVLKKDCPKPNQCTKLHERYSKCPLGECVAKTCDDLGKPIACPSIADLCPGGCICEEGYVRNKQGECIEKNNCPSCGGDPNAVSGCGNPCGKTCDSYNKTDIVCLQYCEVNGCDCRNGFVLNVDIKKCVLKKDCPKASCGGDPNAVSGCGNPCGKTCDSYNKTDVICPQYCEVNGCDCRDGFVLNEDLKKCVLKKDCPKPNQCTKPHERYSKCPLGECVAKTCDDLGKPIACPSIADPCPGGCICEEANCGGDPNAVSGCGNPCGKTCDDYNKTDLICPQYCKVGGCDCKDGYVLNQETKKCVLKEDCSKPVTCSKPHERYIDCLSGQCTPKKCDDIGKSLSCPFVRGPCPGGCICEEGYLRDANGTCIKLEQCPPKPCGTNQTWVAPCNFPCPDKICPRDDKPTPKCEVLQPCYPGCQCKLNYRLNATWHCILAPDCPAVKCTRQNEVYDSCPSACLRENCEDINNQPKTCNTLISLCSPRCVCAKGYFRNKDGLCIPANQCPVQCTKPNEKYIDCLPGQCNPKTCDELENPAPCPRIKPPCPGGCICVEGYVRNANGTCIKKENCPSTDS